MDLIRDYLDKRLVDREGVPLGRIDGIVIELRGNRPPLIVAAEVGSVAQARRLGMSGISIIHPKQIDAANAAFTPSAEDIAYAREVLAAFDEARARGVGAIAFRGQLLDFPIVDRARQTVALAKSLGALS